MYAKKILAYIIGALTFGKVFSLECRTCRGVECYEKDVALTECTRRIPELPYTSSKMSTVDLTEAKYSCISLEYENDQGSKLLAEQCYLIYNEDTCEIITNSLPSDVQLSKCELYVDEQKEKRSNYRSKRQATVIPTSTEVPQTTTAEPQSTNGPPQSTNAPPQSTNAPPQSTNTPPQVTNPPETTEQPEDNGVAGITSSVIFILGFLAVHNFI